MHKAPLVHCKYKSCLKCVQYDIVWHVTFIHVVLQAPPTQVYLSSIQSEWLLTRKLWEDKVTELSLQL